MITFYGEEVHAVGFDLNGTLIDSDPANYGSVLRTCDNFGIQIDPNRRKFTDMSNAEIFKMITRECGFGRANSVGELVRFKKQLFAEMLRSAEPIPGAVEFFRKLLGMGLPVVIATSASSFSLDAALSSLKIKRDEPSVLLPADSLGPGESKPNKAHWERALQLCRVAPRQMLVVENAPRGVTSSHEAGCRTGGLLTTHTAPELYAAGAEFVFETFEELGQLLVLD